MPIEKISQLTDVWNSGSYHYDSIKLDVADYASSDDSNLINLQVNHDEKFAVDKYGNVKMTYLTASGVHVTGNLVVSGTASFGYASASYAATSSWSDTTINSISSSWASSSISSSYADTSVSASITTSASYALYAVSASVTSSFIDIRWIDSNTFVDDTNFAVSSSMTHSVDLGSDTIGGVFFTANCQISSGSIYSPAGIKVVAKDGGGNIIYDYGVVASIASGSLEYSSSINDSSSYAITSSYSYTSSVASLAPDYLPLTGGVMTGQLVLNNDPLQFMEAATKNYVDSKVPDTASYAMTSSVVISSSYSTFAQDSYSSSYSTLAANAANAFTLDTTATASYAKTSSFISTPHSKSVNGYTYLPNGIIMQWGTSSLYTTQGQQTITFPISFPNACLNVQTCWRISTDDTGNTADTWTQVRSYTNSTATFTLQNSDTGTFTAGNISWTAIGY